MTDSRRLLRLLIVEMVAMDRPPVRFSTHSEADDEREFAARQPFTALDYALSVDRRYHPATWRAVKGTPFEGAYRRALHVPESVDYDLSNMFEPSNPNSYYAKMKRYSKLLPLDKRTPWQIANREAKERFGDFGLATCHEDEMDKIINMKEANKIADEDYGEFGFATLTEKEMEELLNSHPELLRSAKRDY